MNDHDYIESRWTEDQRRRYRQQWRIDELERQLVGAIVLAAAGWLGFAIATLL